MVGRSGRHPAQAGGNGNAWSGRRCTKGTRAAAAAGTLQKQDTGWAAPRSPRRRGGNGWDRRGHRNKRSCKRSISAGDVPRRRGPRATSWSFLKTCRHSGPLLRPLAAAGAVERRLGVVMPERLCVRICALRRRGLGAIRRRRPRSGLDRLACPAPASSLNINKHGRDCELDRSGAGVVKGGHRNKHKRRHRLVRCLGVPAAGRPWVLLVTRRRVCTARWYGGAGACEERAVEAPAGVTRKLAGGTA